MDSVPGVGLYVGRILTRPIVSEPLRRPLLLPLRDALTTWDLYQAEKHAIVRAGFLDAVREDARVQSAWHDWGDATGWTPEAIRSGHTDDQLLDLMTRMGSATPGHLMEQLGPLARQLVEALSAPWPWLAMELLMEFFLATDARALGREYEYRLLVNPDDVPVPATIPTAEEGEAVGAYYGRLMTLTVPVASANRPKKLYRSTERRLKKAGRWICAHDIGRMTYERIAVAEYPAATDGGENRGNVYTRVKEARALLELARFRSFSF